MVEKNRSNSNINSQKLKIFTQKSKINNQPSTIFIGEITSTPLGSIWVVLSERGLVAVEFGEDDGRRWTNDKGALENIEAGAEAIVQQVRRLEFYQVLFDQERTAEALNQISEYLQGERRGFDLPIDWSVLTPFQEQVLRATFVIPYGQTTTYGDIARKLGMPRAARAVGRAEATNPMPLVIPCHRVLGSDGGLHGYGAGKGLETKAWLLRLEKGEFYRAPGE